MSILTPRVRADFISVSIRAAQSGVVGKNRNCTVTGQSPKVEDASSRDRPDLRAEREFTGEIRTRIEESTSIGNLWLQGLVG